MVGTANLPQKKETSTNGANERKSEEGLIAADKQSVEDTRRRLVFSDELQSA